MKPDEAKKNIEALNDQLEALEQDTNDVTLTVNGISCKIHCRVEVKYLIQDEIEQLSLFLEGKSSDIQPIVLDHH